MSLHKLGKHPVRHDPRTFKLADYLPTLPSVPDSTAWGAKVNDWTMMGNDTVGDCTCAGAGHHIMNWTVNATAVVIPTLEQILAAYSAITGYNPDDPASDQGANMLDVLKYWRKHGIAGHKIVAFMKVDVTNVAEVKAAIALFANLYTGVNLPKSAEEAFARGQVWSDTTDKDILGGHCIAGVDYTADEIVFVTWAKSQPVTYPWLITYADEAYVIVTQDWIAANGESPSGLKLAQLLADVKQV